jgi:integrase
MTALPADNVRTLMAVCADDGSVYADAIVIAAQTGLRLGELLALRWQDVDLDARTLRVTGSLRRQSGRGQVRGEAKNPSSNRVVSYGSDVDAALRRQQAAQRVQKVRWGPDYQQGGYCLVTGLGAPLSAENTRRAWLRLRELAALPSRARIHDLRHTHATMLLADGMPVNDVAARLGHASAKMTLDVYGHAVPDNQQDAVRRLERLLG